MIDPFRNLVISVGDLGPSTLDAFSARHLSLSNLSLPDLSRAPYEAARAVLLPFEGDRQSLAKVLAKFAEPVLDSGAMCAVVLTNRRTAGRDGPNAGEVIGSLSMSRRSAGRATDAAAARSLSIPCLNAWEPSELAQACLEHEPGRAARAGLVIEQKRTEHQFPVRLLQRAFSEFTKLRISPLQGGRSRASGVWKVHAQDYSQGQVEPFVVKSGKIGEISDEIGNAVEMVADRTPFPFYCPVLLDRCVTGATQRLVVSRFIDRATRFDDYLEQYSAALAISALFDGPLRSWRAPDNQKESGPVKIGELYKEYWAIPDVSGGAVLEPAYRQAKERAPGRLESPAQLLTRLFSAPPIRCKLCISHGDLHARNIFVRHNSLDVILIDYAKVHPASPMSRDPATLDVALGFDVCDDKKPHIVPLPEKALLRLYTSPLFAYKHTGAATHRVEAIGRVRTEARTHCSPEEYDLSVACCLLRFARLPPPAGSKMASQINRLRGLAYTCAARITRSVTSAPPSR